MKIKASIILNLLFCTILFVFQSLGQLQNNNWIFGYGARVNFAGANPVASTSSISSNEATASVSDPTTGQLLFYTDARRVWNANNQVMPNGANLLGGYFTSCTQGALIVPFPDDNQRYYLFTLDELEVEPGNPVVDDGLRYSVVDMTLNGGLGDVQTSNMNTQLATDLTEKMIVIRSPEIQGFWVITHRRNANEFLAWKVDACGVNLQPVVSTVGSNFINIPSIGYNEGWSGAMDASPDGNRIGMPVDFSTRLEFFDFNKTTGAVSNPLTVNVTDDATAPFLRKYGACFSPDGSKFYYTNTNSVYQLDLSTYTSAAIASSHTLIYSTMFQPIAYPCFQIEQAPNNKLYVAVGNSPRLDEISNPNALGLSCGYVDNAVNLTPGVVQLCLPDQVPLGGFAACNSNPCPPVTVTASQTNATCNGATDGSATVVASGGASFTYAWSPSGGSNATASGLAAGTYTCTISNECGNSTTQSFTITEPEGYQLNATVVQPTCGNENGCISFDPTPAGTYFYTWPFPSNWTVDSVCDLAPGSYDITINSVNGCPIDTTIILTDINSLAVEASPESSTISLGDSIQLSATGGVSYTWSPSNGLSCLDCANPIATPNLSTIYFVTATDLNGCSGSDSVYVTVLPVSIECGDVYIPTVFAPKGIGSAANKTICVYGNCITQLTFEIYNRWGEKVFETTDLTLSECWDGTYEGKELNAGTFLYKLVVTLNNETIEDSGTITLIR
ncbi:MAG: gliding motility-associated C-terminal domain-containing protein [Cryomorphaceae bacterium]|nr:gliding motility-associated C-terminal domain-containing protein [Cryomorphaceae bacterium]